METSYQAGYAGARIPRLTYRNAIPTDDAVHLAPPRDSAGEQPANDPRRLSGPSIREIRLSMSQGQAEDHNLAPPDFTMPLTNAPSKTPPRKKSSLFGSLFAVKEPTQLALNQVTAQMIAQHGSANARKVPNVSMEKMPQHVPKVNAKWDGIPDAVKQREKKRARAAKRQSMTSSTIRSQSSERVGRPSGSRASEHSGHSRESRARSLHSSSRKHDSYAPNPHRFYAQSVNSSGDLAAQQRPDDEESRPSSSYSPPPSLKSSSSKSVADGTGSDDIPPPPKIPAHLSPATAKDKRRATSPKAPSADAVPGQTRSPVATPREGSPVTPIHQSEEHVAGFRIATGRRDEMSLVSSGPDVLPLPVSAPPKTVTKSNTVFLAGEAQEFQLPDDDSASIRSTPPVPPRSVDRTTGVEKRPDSSRERLGLRASMVVKQDSPWAPGPGIAYERPPSADDRTNAQLKPKSTISKAFGSLLKREM